MPFGDEDEARRQNLRLKDALDGKAPMPASKPLDKKHAKLRKDLEVVIENIVLANQMIDNHDPAAEVEENDALVTLIQSLFSFENKIVEIIGKIKNDEVMHLALLSNDDMQKTIKRYKKVEHGRVPEPFLPECRKYLPGYKVERPKPEERPRPAEVRKEPERQRVEVSRPAPVSKPMSSTAADIFGIDEEVVSEPVRSRAPPPKAHSSASDDLFGISFDDPPPTKSNSAMPLDSGSNISKLNEIMNQMSLEQRQKEKMTFNTGMPGMGGGPPPMGGFSGGFGMHPPSHGGFGGGPGFGGPSPGMFNTGMPAPGMPPPGMFNTGMPPPMNSGFGGGFGGGFGTGMPPPKPMNTGFGGSIFDTPKPVFGGGMPKSNDPFAGNSASIFSKAPSNYNPGGGPQAFNKKKLKKNDGPAEFKNLFGMANKMSDRLDQPKNSIDDYVTSYKNNYNDAGYYGDFGGGSGVQQNESDINDFFGGGSSKQSSDTEYGGNSNSADTYGYDNFQPQANPTHNLEDDFFGGGGSDNYNQPDNDPFGDGGHSQDHSQQNYNYDHSAPADYSYNQPGESSGYDYNQFESPGGYDYNQESSTNQNYNNKGEGDKSGSSHKQEELFDIFG